MLVSVRIRVRPEDVRALEESARSITRQDFTVPTAPDACALTTATALERLGMGTEKAGAALMGGGRAGLHKVVVRGTFTPRTGSTDVSLVGVVGEIVPLTVTTAVLGVVVAAATFMGCFTLRLNPALAGVGMVVVGIAAGVGWAKWRASAANAATAVLASEFRRLAPSSALSVADECGSRIEKVRFRPVNDTHPAAEAVQLQLLRSAGITKRASIALRLSQDVVTRSRRALAETMPGASELEVNLRWVELWYGRELAQQVRRYLDATRPR